MKKFLIFFLLLSALDAMAQVPEGINYQGAVSADDGTALVNANLDMRFTIYALGTGSDLYVETQMVATDAFGTFAAVVGQGTPVLGTYAAIDWTDNTDGFKALRVEADNNSDGNYTVLQDAQLLSVPFALYAPEAFSGPIGPAGAPGATGPNGLPGINGAPGPQGMQGPTGPTGPAGVWDGISTGPAGPPGPTGTVGPNSVGPTGAQGPTGIIGAPGAQGPTGPPGPAGPQAAPCPNGPQGPVGSSFWASNGPNVVSTLSGILIKDEFGVCWAVGVNTDGTISTTTQPCP